MIALNEKAIIEHMMSYSSTLCSGEVYKIELFHFTLYDSIDSTNRVLKDSIHHSKSQVAVCCAETQTAGRGRFGRHWHSPFGENIYCSTRWHFNCDIAHLAGLSLVVSLAVLSALNQLGISESIQVKWPNDLLWHNKKLCGCLIEIVAESQQQTDVIIGVGLNVNATEQSLVNLDKPWCSLQDITGDFWDRNQIIAVFLLELYRYIESFKQQGLAPFVDEWKRVDYLQGRTITVTQAEQSLTGMAMGINVSGQLILMDDNQEIRAVSSGDTSVRY